MIDQSKSWPALSPEQKLSPDIVHEFENESNESKDLGPIVRIPSREKPNQDHRLQAMSDIVDQATRSRMMAGIRSQNTRPEVILRRALHARGFRYRLHDKRLPGKPDLVFPRYAAVCLVHGCFWRRHPWCAYATTPATRPEFWQAKFDANTARDQRNRRKLLEAGWRVATVWECALRKGGEAEVVSKLDRWLRGGAQEFNANPIVC